MRFIPVFFDLTQKGELSLYISADLSSVEVTSSTTWALTSCPHVLGTLTIEICVARTPMGARFMKNVILVY